MAIFSGDIFAEQYVISSSVTNVTIGSVSGSTAFGDSQDDNHRFTGSLITTGSVTIDDGTLLVQPNNSDLTDNSGLGLYVKGQNAGIKILTSEEVRSI